MARRWQRSQQIDPAAEAFSAGYRLLTEQPIFVPMLKKAVIVREEGNLGPERGWAVVSSNGYIHTHPTRRGEPGEWQYVLAHCLLHLAFAHFRQEYAGADFSTWNVACDCFVARFLAELKIGMAPVEIVPLVSIPGQSEEALYRRLRDDGVPGALRQCGTAGGHGDDMLWGAAVHRRWDGPAPDWPQLFAQGVQMAVTREVARAGNLDVSLKGDPVRRTQAEEARRWFMASYPLLGALAAGFDIVESPEICQRMHIGIAAVDARLKEIYLTPAAGLNDAECRFVMAHEMLHVGLRHDQRLQGRDPFLWNVACDYVINGWLLEMGIGTMPARGLLHDESLRGLSAESIYDQIVRNLRTYRKLWTLRGKGIGDIVYSPSPAWWESGAGLTLDEFYRRALVQGLELHFGQAARGLLPAGLVEEILALDQPPIPWDVALARWFDLHFAPQEKRRSYARPSRRQAATPTIPQPSWTTPAHVETDRTFGVLLDTSGSMDRRLLADALGAIASYSMARDVPLVRVLFCDATYYDQGYLAPEVIAGRVKVRGRGGTILQPAIDFLEKADDFPKNGPLLIITDTECDPLTLPRGRDHAYLLPRGRRLPFPPKGPVFYMA